MMQFVGAGQTPDGLLADMRYEAEVVILAPGLLIYQARIT